MEGAEARYHAENEKIWKQYAELKGEPVTQDQISPRISVNLLGGRELTFVHYKAIPTTMVPAQDWPEQLVSKQTCFVFQAEEQLQGKGQHQNLWASPPGNAYLSFLTEIDSTLIPLLPILASSAIIRTIGQLLPGEQVQCKWVNDILVRGAKVAGLLTKTVIVGPKILAIIGIGVNINSAPLQGSGCLNKMSHQDIPVTDLSKRLVLNLLRGLNNKQDYFLLYQKHLIFLGQQVKILDSALQSVRYEGTFTGINQHGHALLTSQGQQMTVTDGRMRPEGFVPQ